MLAVSLLLVVALAEILPSKLRDSRRSWLLGHLWATFFFNAVTFIDDVIYSLQARPFYVLEYPMILLAAICYGELCYAVAGLGGTRHHKMYRLVVAGASVCWTAWLINILVSGAEYAGAEYAYLLGLPIVLFIWPIVVFIGQLKKEGVPVFQVGKLVKEVPTLRDRHKAMLGFLLDSILRLLSSAVPILGLLPNIPWELVYGLFFTNNVFIVVVMIVTYLTFIEKRTNVASKLVATCSMMLLTAFAVVTLIFFTEDQEMRGRDAAVLHQNSLLITPQQTGYEATAKANEWFEGPMVSLPAAPSRPAVLEVPFEFPFYGKNYNRLHIYPNGQVVPTDASGSFTELPRVDGFLCVKNQPVIAVFCAPHRMYDIYSNTSKDALVVGWVKKGLAADERQNFVYQMVLTASGDITFNYGSFNTAATLKRRNAIGVHDGTHWPPISSNLDSLPVVGTQGAVWFDLLYGRRLSTDERLKPAAIFLITTMFILLFVIRPYLVRIVVRPLEAMKKGLRRVDEGQLDRHIAVFTRDEFSDIANGFNKMISSLDQARQQSDEQTDLLESEIQYRTIEAAKKIDPDILSKDQVFENKLREAIENNLSDFDFQVAELAEAMAVSTRQLHRRVVNLTAQTPASLIRNFRLEHGYQLLSARAVNVSEAAYGCGFKDVSYFSKLFQKKYGVAPSELLAAE